MSAKKLLLALALAGALLVTVLSPASVAGDVRYGHTHRADGVLHAGCHTYHFGYRLRPDNVLEGRGNGKNWSAEFFLRDPRGENIASAIMEYQADPRRGRSRLKFCRTSTRPGRFTLRGRLNVKHTVCSTPFPTPFTCEERVKTVWVKATRFRLRRP